MKPCSGVPGFSQVVLVGSRTKEQTYDELRDSQVRTQQGAVIGNDKAMVIRGTVSLL